MQRSKLTVYKILLLYVFISAISCESDNDTEGNRTDFSYFPLISNNLWEYDVKTDDTRTIDELEVTGSTTAGFELTANPVQPNAFMTGVLSNLTLRENNGILLGNGSIDISLGDLNSLNVDIENAILFDQNAPEGRTLYEFKAEEDQVIEGNDLTINYTVSTIQLEDVTSLTVNGVVFEDIIHSQLIVEASAKTRQVLGGTAVDIEVLTKQDVLVIDNYWAKDVGMIKSESKFSYELVDFSAFGITLPIDSSAQILTEQSLTRFILN